MSVYNGERYLREAVESILAQTFGDFEFIIINDGSTDGSREILESYLGHNGDSRITLINQENKGTSASLNRGIKEARGEYIVRMDSDDVSLPERLARLADFMDSHKDVGICGSWAKVIGGPSETIRYPVKAEDIKAGLLFKNTIVHPSIIIRRDLFLHHDLTYCDDPEIRNKLEDYDLWIRSSRFFPLANLGEVLYLYRRHGGQLTNVSTVRVMDSTDRIVRMQLEALDIQAGESELGVHRALSAYKFDPTRDFVEEAERWLLKLQGANKVKGIYAEEALDSILGELWYALCKRMGRLGLWGWRRFWSSQLSHGVGLTPFRRVKLFARALKGQLAGG